MVNIKTESGFSCKIDENVVDDMRFLRLLRKADENSIFLDDLARAILGDDATEALYNHIEEDNRVPIEKFSNELREIIEKIGEKIKKS